MGGPYFHSDRDNFATGFDPATAKEGDVFYLIEWDRTNVVAHHVDIVDFNDAIIVPAVFSRAELVDHTINPMAGEESKTFYVYFKNVRSLGFYVGNAKRSSYDRNVWISSDLEAARKIVHEHLLEMQETIEEELAEKQKQCDYLKNRIAQPIEPVADYADPYM